MFQNAVNIEVAVFSRGVPITNQFQVQFTSCYKHFFSSCIDICFQVVVYKLLQVGTHCLCVDVCFQVVVYKLLHVVFASCCNVLQVHVSTRSEMT